MDSGMRIVPLSSFDVHSRFCFAFVFFWGGAGIHSSVLGLVVRGNMQITVSVRTF